MKYFQVVGETTDQVAKKILKDYNGRAYIIKLVKEMKKETSPKKWYHRLGLKPPEVTKFYYRAYCSLPEDNEDMNFIRDLNSAPSSNSLSEEKEKLTIPSDISRNSNDAEKEQLQSDILQLKEVVGQLYKNANRPKKEERFLPVLLDWGFSYKFSQTFLSSLQTDIRDENILKLILKEKMRMRLNLKEGFLFEEGRNYLFLGPTGVGKTTTLAKMAALCYKQGKRNFRFVSFDSYRLGADEQLKRFADIFEKPFELVQNMQEMKKLVKSRKPGEILFLDTAGESIQKEIKIPEVLSYMELLKEPTSIFLVLSVHSKIEDLWAIANQFKDFSVNYYIITKLDETSRIGNILEFLSHQREEIIFYTNGQAVPDDIKPVSLEKFFEYI